MELDDRLPHAETDTTDHLMQLHHVVRQEDHYRAVIRIRLPPAAIRTRPSDRPDPAAATPGIRLLRLEDDGDAHAVAMARGEDRTPEHTRRAALFRRELV